MAMQWYQYPITNGYSTSVVPGNFDTPHYADDIGTPFHTPITALEPGTIVQADYAAWGGEVFVKPDAGGPEYYYYHLDRNDVSAGQHVSAGQEIGLSGGENPGYPGALHPTQPQYSTGPHTHVGFWTSWTSGPNGTIPFGPDITSLLNAIKTGQAPIPNNSPAGPTGPAPNSPGTSPGGTPTASSIVFGNWQTTAQSGLVRIGLFLIALLLVGFGLYAMFKTQIDSGVKRGVEVAKLAALA